MSENKRQFVNISSDVKANEFEISSVTRQENLGYKEFNSLERDALMKKWRQWANATKLSKNEKHLRKCIATAMLRLERLDNSNPEVNHARKLLECAVSGDNPTFP